MRSRVILIFMLVLVIGLATASMAEPSEDGSIAVFLVYHEKDYKIGDRVDFELYVFERGQPADPKSVWFELGLEEEDVHLSRASLGVYTGSFTLSHAQTDAYGRVYLQAGATSNLTDGGSAKDAWYIIPEGADRFDVSIFMQRSEQYAPAPGDTIRIHVETSFDGERETPDENFYVGVHSSDGKFTLLEMYGFGGMYYGDYEIPEELDHGGTFQVRASGQHSELVNYYPQQYWVYKDTDTEYFQVHLMEVWAHITEVTEDRSSVDLHVVGLDGKLLDGAEVEYQWEYLDGAYSLVTRTGSGTTDAQGRLPVTLDHAGMGASAAQIGVTGTVTHDELVQDIDGWIWVRDNHSPPPEQESGLAVECLTQQPLPLGRSVTLEHVLLHNGTPLANTVVHYYLSNYDGLYGHGNASTDGTGKLPVDIDVPAEVQDSETGRHIFAYFHVEVEDGVWEQFVLYLDVGPQVSMVPYGDGMDVRITMDVDGFSLGDIFEVRLEHPQADGYPESAWLLWGIGDVPEWTTTRNMQWESWNPGSSNGLLTWPMRWTGEDYRSSLVCPGFLPQDEELFFYGVIYFQDPPATPTRWDALVSGVALAAPNPAPEVTIANLKEGKRYGGSVKISGTATDDKAVFQVQLRVDDKEWQNATLDEGWTYRWETRNEAPGNHTIQVRAFDGHKYSEEVAITVVVDQSVTEDDTKERPCVAILVAAMPMACLAFVVRFRRD